MGDRANVRNFMYFALPLMVLCLLHKGEAIWLSLPPTGTKCVSEELHNNVVVLADYVVISDDQVHPTPTISARVWPFLLMLINLVSYADPSHGRLQDF